MKQFNGRLSLGDSPISYPVIVRIEGNGIAIDGGLSLPENSPPDLVKQIWYFQDLDTSVPLTGNTEEVLLSHDKQPGATLYVADPEFVSTLAVKAPGLTARSWRLTGLNPAGGITATVAALAGLIYVSDFSPAKTIARVIPDSARTSLGLNVIKSFTKRKKVCSERNGQRALEMIMSKLSKAAGLEKPFKVTVLDWQLVNAFAAPGGQLVLTRGLIRRASSADMVAGVMAHEMGHGIEYHPEAGLVRAIGMSAAGEFFFTGSSSTLKNIGLVLATLSYTREAEREADNHALTILKKSGTAAKPLADFFASLEKKSGKSSLGKVLKKYRFLSTHPPNPERAKLFAAQKTYPTTPILSAKQWQDLRDICGRAPTRQEREKKLKERLKKRIETQSALLAADPNNTKALQKRAIAYSRLKQYDKALADANRLIELEPGKARHWSRRAYLHHYMKKYDEAVADYTKAIELDPDKSFRYAARARLYARQNKTDKAIADLSHAISLSPKNTNYLKRRGDLYTRQKNFQSAIYDYNALLAIAPKRTSVYVARAVAKRELKDFTGALADLDHVIKLSPRYAYAYFQRGETFNAMDRTKEAIASYSKSIEIHKPYLRALFARAQAYEKLGTRDAAIADYRRMQTIATKYQKSIQLKLKAQARLKALSDTKP